MADLRAHLEDLQLQIKLLHEEKGNLLEHLKQQECHFYATISDFVSCFKEMVQEKDNEIQKLREELASLKNSGN